MSARRESSGALGGVALAAVMFACCALPLLLGAGIAASAIAWGAVGVTVAAASVAIVLWLWWRRRTARCCDRDTTVPRTARSTAPTDDLHRAA